MQNGKLAKNESLAQAAPKLRPCLYARSLARWLGFDALPRIRYTKFESLGYRVQKLHEVVGL